MNSYINYIIEANLGLILFMVMYVLLLQKETDFKFLRIFLVGGILASIILPLFRISSFSLYSQGLQIIPSYMLPEVQVGNNPEALIANPLEYIKDWWFYILLLYCAGAIFFLVRFCIQVCKLIHLIVKAEYAIIGKYRIIESANLEYSFSFFNFIFIGQSDILSKDEKEKITQHETVHARELHSLDIILLNIVSILFWFNPVVKIYKKTLIQLHEFEADARAVDNHEVNGYCSLLAKVALHSAEVALANHFNQSLTLKRIIMLRKIKAKIQPWKMVICTCFITGFFYFVVSHDQVMAQQQQEKKIEASETNEVFYDVEVMPAYQGGLENLYAYLGKNIKYPKEARKANIQGKVVTEFIVEKDGTVSGLKVVEGIGKGCDEEAIRALKEMPKWAPGQKDGKAVRTRVVLPVSFKM